jgi:hypothetical protein
MSRMSGGHEGIRNAAGGRHSDAQRHLAGRAQMLRERVQQLDFAALVSALPPRPAIDPDSISPGALARTVPAIGARPAGTTNS